MGEKTAIEWTDATWQPITGCTVVSPGCTHCYAMRIAGTRLKDHPSRQGLTKDGPNGPVWTGAVRLNEEWLDQPLRWRRPRRIFVCAHGDLFHEAVPSGWIDRVFALMANARHHSFQVLTKRADRMHAYIGELDQWVERHIGVPKRGFHWSGVHGRLGAVVSSWPLPNVWLGVSVEDQRRADERIAPLLQTPAAIRFLSVEPLLGSVDLTAVTVHRHGDIEYTVDALRGDPDGDGPYATLDQVIVGGESGAKARPMHPQWARDLRDQCQTAGVSFFFKQWGNWGPINHSEAADEAGWQGRGDWMILDRGGDLDIPDGRWPDEDAGEVAIVRLGKKRAGRLLDGREWNEMPDTPRG